MCLSCFSKNEQNFIIKCKEKKINLCAKCYLENMTEYLNDYNCLICNTKHSKYPFKNKTQIFIA